MARIIIPSTEDPSGWGVVPTTDGNYETSLPITDPQTGAVSSPTQERQTTTANQTAVSQYTFLAPAPVQSPLFNESGYMTPQWVTWFQQLYRRVGDAQSTSVGDLDILTEFDDIPQTFKMPVGVTTNIDAYQQDSSQIGALQTQISDLTAQSYWGSQSVNTDRKSTRLNSSH